MSIDYTNNPDPVNAMLSAELKFYRDHQDEMVERYNGKTIVLKDHQVLGAYTTSAEAIAETTKEHELGTFAIQRVSPGSKDYTIVLHGLRRRP